MTEFNAGLTEDPLFVGATRPPMRWGVTYSALLFNMVFTIVENCGNTLILRCSASEHGGTSQFASRLIGEREVSRRQVSRGSDREGLFARQGARRSKNTSEQRVTEAAVMPSEIEGLPDFCGYLKVASAGEWLKVCFERSRTSDRSGTHGRLKFEGKHQRPFQ
jgi:hypothetical protein